MGILARLSCGLSVSQKFLLIHLGRIEYFELNQMFPQIAKFYNYNLFIVIAGVHQGLALEVAQEGLTF